VFRALASLTDPRYAFSNALVRGADVPSSDVALFSAQRFGTSANPLCSRPQDDGFVLDYEFDTPVKRPHVGRFPPPLPPAVLYSISGRTIASYCTRPAHPARAGVSPRELTRVINFCSSGSWLLPRSVYVSIMTRILMSSQGSSRARARGSPAHGEERWARARA
jgi:hypothetical protein